MMWSCGVWVALLVQIAGSVRVPTQYGQVVGMEKEYQGIEKNGSYYSFQGIPYAAPPVGKLRLKDPVPWEHYWEEDLDVSGGPPSMCPQPDPFSPAGGIAGDEDCLFLNIYTEEVSDAGSDEVELRPVMFWIHGGGFFMGSGAQLGDGSGSDYLIESGLVVVTINYRLGALGFLALEGTNISGNQGLKDQLLALRWVKENIANFGGDPSRITISGESAGGSSVHAHVLSPLGKNEDLFHRAISFSGTVLMWGEMQQSIRESKEFFKAICNTQEESIPTTLDDSCLYTSTTEDFVNEASKPMALTHLSLEEQVERGKEENLSTYLLWPVIDYWAAHPFLPTHPITILHNQQQKMVPYMTGLVKDEGGLMVAPNWKNMKPEDNQLQKHWGYMGAQMLLMLRPQDITVDEELTARMIAHFYVGKDGVNRENRQGLEDLFTDTFFGYPNAESVKLHSQASAPIYNYVMTYRGSSSFVTMFTGGDPDALQQDFGVIHGDDLMYLFKISFGGFSFINTENDKKFVKVWQKLIGDFAKYGDPTPIQDDDSRIWTPVQKSPAASAYFDVGLKPVERQKMFAERMEFWNKLFFVHLLEKYAVSEQGNDVSCGEENVNMYEDKEGSNQKGSCNLQEKGTNGK